MSITKTTSFAITVRAPGIDGYSWSEIKDIIDAGQASTYWSIGDVKQVTLNGTCGTLNLSNETLGLYILGFDHNLSLEADGYSHSVTFGGFMKDGKQVALVDSHYNNSSGSSDGSKWFNMNHWGTSSSPYNTNYGGWAACDLRYDILGSTDQAPSPYGSTKTTSATGKNPTANCTSNPVPNTLMSCLPSDLRSVMKPVNKYTDNKGNSSTSAANVTATKDYLFLLNTKEIYGYTTTSSSSNSGYANANEGAKSVQYDYWKNRGVSISSYDNAVTYRHNNISSSCLWWERSPGYGYAHDFCFVGSGGAASAYYSYWSDGLAPALVI